MILERGRLAFAVALCCFCASAHARPPHRKAMADYFGPRFSQKLNDCRTCHVPAKPGTTAADDDDKPHNPFGLRLKAVRAELRTEGKATTIPSRLERVADEDSDGDGASNFLELLTGHNPGEAEDKPDLDELAAGRKSLAAMRAQPKGYPWAPFEVVKRPRVPVPRASGWIRNPIDAFIAAEHESRGLSHRPEAQKSALLRRVFIDVIGLPPTPEELWAFLADDSVDAYDRVVDRLLSSRLYAERWGRHWMDVWRYSDWAGWGMQVRDSQPHIWRWRDWIIDSLEADKSYDRMIVEMLAGDELAPEDPDVVRATGYLVRNYKLLSREKWMQDVVDHTSQAFLGVTFGCARCHDHMYDPVLQKEYYQVRAIFEPHNVRIDRVAGQADTTKDGLARAFDADLGVKTVLFIRGDDRTPGKEPLQPGVPEALGGWPLKVEPVSLPKTATAPDRRPLVRAALLAAAEHDLTTARSAEVRKERTAAIALIFGVSPNKRNDVTKALYDARLAKLDRSIAESRLLGLGAELSAEQLEESGSKDSPTWRAAALTANVAQRAQAQAEAERKLLLAQEARRSAAPTLRAESDKAVADAIRIVARARDAALAPAVPQFTARAVATYPAASTGRRLAFARWIASDTNPLTARVAVNHIWLRHFGQAIVPSVSDFGRNGQPATHPALLDWLAAEFMDRGWSMKGLHRLILTSATYRQASTPDASNLALDPDNTYLWRMSSRRLEAEAVRDCLYYVANRLDLRTGGPEIDFQAGLTVPRRSIYFRHAAEKQMEFLKIFDGPSVTECYKRKDSILPQQALALANSSLSLEIARSIAADLRARTGTAESLFIKQAFERLLSRPPTEKELEECQSFLASRSDGPAAGESLIHVLLNHHEFVTIR
jgi:Protein of unknown function (DUF1553)/Protein of unknown function (DUF1549)